MFTEHIHVANTILTWKEERKIPDKVPELPVFIICVWRERQTPKKKKPVTQELGADCNGDSD